MSDEVRNTVELPASVYDDISERVGVSEFDTVEEYVTFTMQEVISRIEQKEAASEFSAEDESIVEDRLDALGYVD